jgi:hypothetical protein
MATLYKAQLIEADSPWLEAWDEIYAYLRPTSGPILNSLRFHAERDLLIPDEAADLTKDEDEEIRRIATQLTHAAACSQVPTDGVLIATLKKIEKTPTLYNSDQLPEAIEWKIASHYQRHDEKPATNWRDVWGNFPETYEGQVEPATDENIARAAASAAEATQDGRRRGRPPNHANRILADGLGEIFRSSGQRISRCLRPEDRNGGVVYIEVGPFCDFLNLVLPPLRKYLRERELAPVSVATIIRLVTEDFPISQ